MPATIVISILDFNIFTLINQGKKPTIEDLAAQLKQDFEAKKVHSNVKKLEKNGLIKITKKGVCQLTASSRKELITINKRIDRINDLEIPIAA